MELYFAPLACSLATRIALYEAGATARYTQADTRNKTLLDGSDFFAVNPMGQVPVLRLDDGSTLTENTAILQYVAEKFPHARLAPGVYSGVVPITRSADGVDVEVAPVVVATGRGRCCARCAR